MGEQSNVTRKQLRESNEDFDRYCQKKKICEMCGIKKILDCVFRYEGKENFKFKIYVHADDYFDTEDNYYDWDSVGDISTVKSFSNLEEFLNDFPWVKTIYSEEKYEECDREPDCAFCGECFKDLILRKKIKYLNNGRDINLPLYTDCCDQLYDASLPFSFAKEELMQIWKMNDFPYRHYYSIFHPYNGEWKAYIFDEFPYKNKDEKYMVCKKCMKDYKTVSEKEFRFYDKNSNPLDFFRSNKYLINNLSVETIDEKWGPINNCYIKHLRTTVILHKDLRDYFNKRRLFNKTLKNLDKIKTNKSQRDSSVIGSANYLNKNIRRIIARKIATNKGNKEHPFL